MVTLFVGVLASAFGVAYLIYGRRQAKYAPMVAGVVLCICPYFIDSVLWLCVVGGALVAVPFLVDF